MTITYNLEIRNLNSLLFLTAPQERLDREMREAEEAQVQEVQVLAATKKVLKAEWKERGKALYRHQWHCHSASYVSELIRTAKTFSLKYTKMIKGDKNTGIVWVVHSTSNDPTVLAGKACKYLHLLSKHNALADALHRYVKLHYQSVFVTVI